MSGCHVAELEAKEVRNHSIIEQQLLYKKPVLWKVTMMNEKLKLEEEIILNDYGYDPANDDIDQEQVERLGKLLAIKINRAMRNPTIDANGNIVPGENGLTLSEQQFVDKVVALDFREKTMKLPIEIVEPTVKEDQLAGIMNYVIGSYTTYFNPHVYGRAANIELSSQAINHYVLGPGDQFSFNEVVGERTRERGYQEAYEIVNNEFVIGIGGGICQTSSTLFNAIDYAGLGVIERHAHTQSIGYVPPNRDATVSWGGPDFKFVNPYDYPVLIKTEVSKAKGELKVLVFAEKNKDLLVQNSR